MENIKSVSQCLGGVKVIGKVQNEADFIPIIRKGLPFSALKAVSRSTKLSELTLYNALKISIRTRERRAANAKPWKTPESEFLLRLARIFTTATDLLGDKKKALQWLQHENRALNNEQPINLLDTGIGFQNVLDVLKRVEFGVYS